MQLKTLMESTSKLLSMLQLRTERPRETGHSLLALILHSPRFVRCDL